MAAKDLRITKEDDMPVQEKPKRGRPKIATVCPVNKEHKNTRVYKTLERVRRCVCDDCGANWKQVRVDGKLQTVFNNEVVSEEEDAADVVEGE